MSKSTTSTKWGSRKRRQIARQGQRRHAPFSLEDMAPEIEAFLPGQTEGRQINIALDHEPQPEDTNIWENTILNSKIRTAVEDADQCSASNATTDGTIYGNRQTPTP